MSRTLAALTLGLIGVLSAAPAQATTWADYEEAFPPFPCHDGWVACYEGGQRVEPDLVRGASGQPMPASARLDFFTLAPTPAFSPFGGLSEYPLGGAAVAMVEPEPVPEPMTAPEPYDPEPVPYTAPEPSGYAPTPSPTPSPTPTPTGMVRPGATPAPSPAPEPGGMVRPGSSVAPAPAPGGMVRPGSTPVPAPAPEPGGMVRPGSTPAPTPEPVVAVQPVTQPEPGGMVRPGTNPVSPAPTPAPTGVVGVVTCDNLVALEPMAMIGRLSDEQVACLEAGFADAERQTDKKKISLLLIVNANGKGDKRAWEMLIRRHLEEIDQSDPDLCYQYAAHLARKGPGRAQSVIHWSEVALENRTRWVGETYKSRVYALYKLRAVAANTLWQQAEERHAAAPSGETEGAVEETRGRTKTYAREWYEYAKEAGKDTTTPLQLCISAAGTAEFCEGR